MGGLDARYMVSQLQPKNVDVKSLVTVATPHHGSAVADYVIQELGPRNLSRIYGLWKQATGWEHDAFDQLTRKYMTDNFNPRTPDDPSVRYFSYGAMILGKPPLLSPFRGSFRLLNRLVGLSLRHVPRGNTLTNATDRKGQMTVWSVSRAVNGYEISWKPEENMLVTDPCFREHTRELCWASTISISSTGQTDYGSHFEN